MTDRTPTRRLRLTRRDALRLAGVGGAVAVGGGAAAASAWRAREHVVATECRFCTMHCGLLATVKGRDITEVRGDPSSQTRGFICEHGRALKEVVHGADRLRTPLIRKGDAFVEASWDDALGLVADKLAAVKAQHGARALAVQTGWPFVRHPMIHLLHRFCRSFGTPNLATVASLCEASGRMGRALVWGSNYSPDLTKTRTLFVWGANPPRTAPPWAFMVTNVKKRGKLVVIDPVRTDIARIANLYLPIRPGTDGALALGMLQQVFENRWTDEAFIAEHVSGVDALKQLAAEWPLARCAQVTGVSEGDIKTAAQWFATEGPGGVYDGLGIEHHGAGVDTVRLVASLVAVCGYADAQAMHDHASSDAHDPLPICLRVEQQAPVPPGPVDTPVGDAEFPLFCAIHRQAQASTLPRAMMDGAPYPIRALICMGANPAVTTPDSLALRRAYEKLDLLVVVDPFLSETAELADVVLPASSFAEQPPLRFGAGERPVAVVDPRGSSKPDSQILFELARRMDLRIDDAEAFPWSDIHAAFQGPRTAVVDEYAAQKLRPTWSGAPPRFPTASGKIELESTLLPRFGLPAAPQVIIPSVTDAHPLVLVTGPRQRAYINSQFHRTPSIARLVPAARAQLHARTAKLYGIEEATRVRVKTPAGDAVFLAEISPDVVEGTVVVPSGWDKDANANRLTSAQELDPISGFPRLRAIACAVEPA